MIHNSIQDMNYWQEVIWKCLYILYGPFKVGTGLKRPPHRGRRDGTRNKIVARPSSLRKQINAYQNHWCQPQKPSWQLSLGQPHQISKISKANGAGKVECANGPQTVIEEVSCSNWTAFLHESMMGSALAAKHFQAEQIKKCPPFCRSLASDKQVLDMVTDIKQICWTVSFEREPKPYSFDEHKSQKIDVEISRLLEKSIIGNTFWTRKICVKHLYER